MDNKREFDCDPFSDGNNKRNKRDDYLFHKNIEDFISLVTSQYWGRMVIVLGDGEHPFVALQNSLDPMGVNYKLKMDRDLQTSEFTLTSDDEVLAKGKFKNQKEAKVALGWMAIDYLHKYCFTVLKKNKYIQVPDSDLRKPKEPETQTKTENPIEAQAPPESDSGPMVGSIAHKMMLKMGWGGGGLGVEEQGVTESIIVNENIDRRGFGHDNVTDALKNLLVEYSRSNKITALAFSKDFTKDERAMIHKFCSRFKNLKTKSVGHGEDRYLTVSRKITRIDIVREMLKNRCENEFYKLVIPENFIAEFEKRFPDFDHSSFTL